MLTTLTTILISFASSCASAFAGWFFGRKRQKIENINAATDTFNKIVESLEQRVEKLLEQGKQDSLKIESLSKQIDELNQKISILELNQKNKAKLEKKIKHYEKILDDNDIDY